MSTPFPNPVTLEEGYKNNNSLISRSLFNSPAKNGSGHIAYDESQLDSVNQKRAEITDYIRLRLADGIVDVELDKEHYELAINQALIKYRQRSQNSVEESYAFLDLLPETQEYILPKEIQNVRQIFRLGIGSVTGTSASQFEPFASGYLNTYMLVAGRVGGLANYELFTQYQELSMRMFGGYMNYTFNPVTKKLTIVRKMPNLNYTFHRLSSLTATGTHVGSTITIEVADPWYNLTVNNTVTIMNCPVGGFNNSYAVESISEDLKTITVRSKEELAATTVDGPGSNDLRITNAFSNDTDTVSEIVLLWIYNTKPDSMIFNDIYAFPWIQEYAYSFAKRIVGEAREKFSTIQGPQGGTSLNGASLKSEAQTEMEALEQQLKDYVDNSQPLTWVIG